MGKYKFAMRKRKKRADQVKENYFRRKAYQLGIKLQKAKARKSHSNKRGGYRMIGLENNFLLAGENFELTLDDVEKILSDREKDFTKYRPGDFTIP